MSDEITPNTQTPQTEAPQEPISLPEVETAQIPPTEPLASEPEPIITPEVQPEPLQSSSEAKAEPEKEETEISEPEPTEKPETKSETPTEPNTNSAKAESSPIPAILPPQNKIRELLSKARNAIQTRKRKKLEKIMTLFAKQTNITNDEVEKLLHVSDATATRYLTILKKENKIKQNGKTGKSVSYSKI